MYTTCEAGKRRSVNHARARSLALPRLAEAVARWEERFAVKNIKTENKRHFAVKNIKTENKRWQ